MNKIKIPPSSHHFPEYKLRLDAIFSVNSVSRFFRNIILPVCGLLKAYFTPCIEKDVHNAYYISPSTVDVPLIFAGLFNFYRKKIINYFKLKTKQQIIRRIDRNDLRDNNNADDYARKFGKQQADFIARDDLNIVNNVKAKDDIAKGKIYYYINADNYNFVNTIIQDLATITSLVNGEYRMNPTSHPLPGDLNGIRDDYNIVLSKRDQYCLIIKGYSALVNYNFNVITSSLYFVNNNRVLKQIGLSFNSSIIKSIKIYKKKNINNLVEGDFYKLFLLLAITSIGSESGKTKFGQLLWGLEEGDRQTIIARYDFKNGIHYIH